MKRNTSFERYGIESTYAGPKNDSKNFSHHTSSRNSQFKENDDFMVKSSSLHGGSEVINDDYY